MIRLLRIEMLRSVAGTAPRSACHRSARLTRPAGDPPAGTQPRTRLPEGRSTRDAPLTCPVTRCEPQSAGADWGSRTIGLPAGVGKNSRRGDHADAHDPEGAVHPSAQRRN